MEKLIRGVVQKGKFKAADSEEFRRSFWGFEGKEVVVSVSLPKKKRSKEQNKYLWAVVYKLIADYVGHTADQIHYAMRDKFLRFPSEKMGYIVRSTTTLTTVEQEKYHSEIRVWAAEFLSLYIPEPNEVGY